MTKPNTNIKHMRSLSILIVFAAVLTSCGGGSTEESNMTSDSTNAMTAERNVAVTSLQSAPVDFNHYFTVQGLVETDQNALIYPEVPAKIISIGINEGDNVSKGQTLLTLDSRVISNQIDELKLRLTLAETIYKKQENLWSQEIGSEIQYLQAKNNYESLEQNLEALESQRAFYTVKAPFSGIVDEITPKVGEMANPAMPLLRLINLSSVYIKSDVTERYLSKIKAGDHVVVTFPSVGVVKESKIERIGNYINPANRTFKIKLSMKNDDLSLKPNLLAELKIRDYYSDSTAVIPTALLQMTPTGDEFVYAVVDNKAQKIMIKTGMTFEGMAEVVDGLSGTELLIDRGSRSVKDGDNLSIQ